MSVLKEVIDTVYIFLKYAFIDKKKQVSSCKFLIPVIAHSCWK